MLAYHHFTPSKLDPYPVGRGGHEVGEAQGAHRADVCQAAA
jgi:hypothetical protein